MKFIVRVKRVPDTEARIRIAGNGADIDPAGIKFVPNPYDEFALEAALRHREAAGSGEVVAVAVGGADSAETLRTALAVGADRAVLYRTDAQLEGLAVARVLAEQLRGQEFDLLLFGMKSVDDDLQAEGTMVAELLDLPSASVVTEFSVDDGKVVAHREIEGGTEIVELPVPCVLTVTKGAYEPRYASLKGIMAAKKKQLDEVQVETADAGTRIEALSYPPERQAGRWIGHGVDAVPELLRILREEAKVL